MAAVAGPPCEPVPSGRLSTGQFDLGWENSIRLAFDLCSSVSSPSENTKVPTRIRNLEWNQSYCSSPFFLFFDFLPCKQSSMLFFLSFSFLLRIRNLVWNQFPVLLLSIFSFLSCEQSIFPFLLRQQIIPTHITEKVSGHDCKEEVMLPK